MTVTNRRSALAPVRWTHPCKLIHLNASADCRNAKPIMRVAHLLGWPVSASLKVPILIECEIP